MEYWGPWATLYKKSGGTINGDVLITGTLGVNGLTTFESLVQINDQLLIIHDDVLGNDPHIRLRSETGAGAVNAIRFETAIVNTKGAIGGIGTNGIIIAPASGGSVEIPSDAITPDPSWKVVNLDTPLSPRRMLMLHSIMFGM